MGRLRIMVRGVEQCVRLISVIVLRVGAIQISDFAQCLVSKAAKIHSSRAVAGRRLEYGGHDAGVYHIRVLTPVSHECSKSCVELYPRLVFLNFSILAQKPPASAPLAAARSEQLQLRRRLGELTIQREIGSVIPDFAGECVLGAVYYQKHPFDRSNPGRSRGLRHGDEGRRAPSADVLRRVE